MATATTGAKTPAPKATDAKTPAPEAVKTEDAVKADGAKDATPEGEKKTPQKKGKYTVQEQVTVSIPKEGQTLAEGQAPETVATDVFIVRGEVEARSKNDAIRQAFNEQMISGAGTYAAVTTRSFAPVRVEPKQRTALTWS